ncbi:MAG: hypothetical protein ACRECR_02490, partial [Thermoplasmata archaeon]
MRVGLRRDPDRTGTRPRSALLSLLALGCLLAAGLTAAGPTTGRPAPRADLVDLPAAAGAPDPGDARPVEVAP